MITSRSKNFIRKEKSLENEEPSEKITIDTDMVQETINKEIQSFEEFEKKIPPEQKSIFQKIIKICKENEIMFEAKSRQIKDELYSITETANLKKTGKTPAEDKEFPKYMNYIAGTTLVVIGALMILSIGCVDWKMCTVDSNPYIQILNSNFFMVLLGTVVGPIVSKYLKEKYDIQIKSEQIAMITNDAIKTVSMYNKSVNELRNDDGKLSEEDKEKIQNLALSSIKNNFGEKKYKDLVSNLSGQAFKKAIEYAVAKNKIETFPLEQEQVEKIVKQSIDAVPHIIDWQQNEPKVKETFIRGYVKGLLQNTGASGWAYKSLEGVFDAEVNKRVAAFAIANARNLISNEETDPMKKYTSIIVDSVLESGIKN